MPNMVNSGSNSNIREASLSGIRNEEEQRKSFMTNNITKIGDAEGDNSAILEGNMILGALGNAPGQTTSGEQNNNSSSFLKNDGSGHE